MGFYNETRDVDSLRTNIILPQSVYREIQRETLIALQGVGIYGELPLANMGSLSYQFQFGTMNIDSDGGTAKYAGSLTGGLFGTDNFDVDDVYAGSIQWGTPLEGLRLGGSILNLSIMADVKTTTALGAVPAGTSFVMDYKDITLYVISTEYTRGNLFLAAEYFNQEIEAEIINFAPASTTTAEGYYASASYRFTEMFELGTYYSIYYPDKDDKDGDALVAQGLPDHGAWQNDLALTARFDINDYWVFKVEGHLMDGTGQVLSVDNADGTEEDWYLFAAKVTFSF